MAFIFWGETVFRNLVGETDWEPNRQRKRNNFCNLAQDVEMQFTPENVFPHHNMETQAVEETSVEINSHGKLSLTHTHTHRMMEINSPSENEIFLSFFPFSNGKCCAQRRSRFSEISEFC